MDHRNITVVFFDTKPYDRKSFDAANQNPEFGFNLLYYENRLTPDSASMAHSAQAVCAFVNDDISEKTIRTLVTGGTVVLSMRCAGYNNVDLSAAYGRLRVLRVPEYSPYAVAEYTLGLLLTLNRSLHRAYCRVRENNFSINGLIGFDLHGKTIGIIGTGRIGQTFARLLQGFGVRILAYDPYPNKEAEATLDLRYVSLPELFRESDVVSLHCPLTPENMYLINEHTLRMMKPGVIILNTSRGKLIDTSALINGLKSKHIGGAGLDVYEEESGYFFEDRSDTAVDDDVLARLLTFPNVIVTSHQAFFTREAVTNIANTTLQNISDCFSGKADLKNEICSRCDGLRSCPGKTPCPKGHH